MKWLTPVEVIPSAYKIEHSDPVMMIGSCFSESIGEKMIGLKFTVDLNPFGILFNPSSIKLCLDRLIEGEVFRRDELIEHNHLWHSFLHHSRFSSLNVESTLTNINERLTYSSSFLRKMHFLFITFGTAWVYTHKKTGKVVANCHKIPAAAFDRHLLSPEDIVKDYRELIGRLKKVNPNVQIIFTVSPVRHLKDTAAGNSLSKATLILAVHQLCREGLATYFPAYEIMLDELRDYRFYADDAIHPSNVAIDHIFEKFAAAFFNNNTSQLNRRIEEILRALEHKIEFPQHPSVKGFADSMLKKIEALETEYPLLDFEKERKYFLGLITTQK
ncbi:MAG: GSCFA domain-containing protein [Bacteroidales bacterium]|nr:GSCFA domain-containing protein [Bacteroidales bacterium]